MRVDRNELSVHRVTVMAKMAALPIRVDPGDIRVHGRGVNGIEHKEQQDTLSVNGAATERFQIDWKAVFLQQCTSLSLACRIRKKRCSYTTLMSSIRIDSILGSYGYL